ncbi:hypothetical protein PCE31106_00883 [Pandoraea cepalis]|uniref:Uncharacterized protein n=1 Tax=Pandoraea cepalis TaxID=2508294 RepID=A0A5E4SMR8_9BURK|nr:hypothetical protein PCE31106_00883 [Pandoraea cepalis]
MPVVLRLKCVSLNFWLGKGCPFLSEPCCDAARQFNKYAGVEVRYFRLMLDLSVVDVCNAARVIPLRPRKCTGNFQLEGKWQF